VSVGLPIDLLCYRTDALMVREKHRVLETDAYFQGIREAWSQGLRDTFARLPDPEWMQ
jgi:putative proteasome-type protease